MNSGRFRVPPGLRIRRAIMRPVFRALFRSMGSVSLRGFENIPQGTPYIAAINHVSIYDPPFMLAFWPEAIEALGASNVFDKPIQGEILALYGVTPVHRGEYDRGLLDLALAMLQSGHALMMAPEGTRSHAPGLGRAKPGIAYIADETRVPVVPVGIVGTTDDFLKRGLRMRRPHLEMRVGAKFQLPALEGRGEQRREARQRNADVVMQHIAALIPPEYRGLYGAAGLAPA